MRTRRDTIKNEISRLEKQANQNLEAQDELEQLRDQYFAIAAEYALNYPEDQSDILPTRFGNTLRAAENYPGERFGFDGVQFWPRLVYVIPTEYKTSIDTVRNELSFLVNMSVLSFVFSLLGWVAIFYTMAVTDIGSGGPVIFLDFMLKVLPYFVAVAGGIISSVFFYNAALFSVGSFGLMIRSSFDLFRLDLLKKMGLERPKDSVEEFDAWSELNELIVLGHHSLTYKKITYREKE